MNPFTEIPGSAIRISPHQELRTWTDALMVATATGDVATVGSLLGNRPEDINKIAPWVIQRELEGAARAGNSEMVACLLNGGAQIKGNFGLNLIHLDLPQDKMIKILDQLVEHGWDVNALYGKCDAHGIYDRKSLIRWICDNDVQRSDEWCEALVRWFLHNGSDNEEIYRSLKYILTRGMKLLDSAAKSGNFGIVRALVEHGADTQSCNAIHYSIDCEKESWRSMIEYLLGHGANIDQLEIQYKQELDWSREDQLKCSKLFELAGMPQEDIVHSRTRDIQAPLHWAIGTKSLEKVKFLVLKGADPNVRSHNGEAPLKLARNLGHEDIAAYLKDLCSIE